MPSGFWELQKSKYLDVIPSPKGFTGIQASIPMQHRCVFQERTPVSVSPEPEAPSRGRAVPEAVLEGRAEPIWL